MNRELRIAILEKVRDILDNIGCARSVTINISYAPDEVPSIIYRVNELILKQEVDE